MTICLLIAMLSAALNLGMSSTCCVVRCGTIEHIGHVDVMYVTKQSTTKSDLAGTSWQLVKFQGSNDSTLKPDDQSTYNIMFLAAGQVNVRVDCNQGRGSWKSTGPNQLQFGPLMLTHALCPPGSLHDQIAKNWKFIRSYVIKDGHLFLSLMAGGGILVFDPAGGLDERGG